MGKSLFNYQVQGVEHLLSKPFGQPHALLADDPGTGKTIMTIEAAKQANCKTGLIICPAIIKEQWRHQMGNWGLAQQDEVQVLYGLSAQLDNRPWKIANYELAREPEIQKQLAANNFHVLVLDEAHRLKTHTSKQTRAILGTHGIGHRCYYKWALSGTIVPNRPVELFPMLSTMAPDVIAPNLAYEKFLDRYCGGRFLAGKGASNIDELTARLQPFMLRRKLEDVWHEMPPLIKNTVYLDVPYQSHPDWIGDGFMEDATVRRVIAEAKAPYVAAYVDDRLNSGVDKIVVFTYHRRVCDELEKRLNKFQPAKIYGGLSLNLREGNKQRFIQNPHCRVLLLQISSGGEGLDELQHVCAEYVYSEPEWSPGKEDQAGRRIMRLGQTRTVFETTILADNSYELTIYNANQGKRQVIDVITQPNGGTIQMSLESEAKRMANALETIAAVLSQQTGNKTEQLAAAVAAQAAPQAPPANVLQFTPAPAAQQAVQPAPVAPTLGLPQPVPMQLPAPVEQAAPAQQVFQAPQVQQPSADMEAFKNQVLNIIQPMGDKGALKMQAVNQQFGIVRLSELNPACMNQYLQALVS
jgi:SWI/SNF-related matrix-associated actin-dependent regulator of chromatin subfamily A-like protein 1